MSLMNTVLAASRASNVQNVPDNFHGAVKWFDAHKGYGFITPIGHDASGPATDVFVHVHDLHPRHCPTPTLYTGEYVQYQLAPPRGVDASVRAKALNVTGIYGGALMCDHGRVTFKHYTRVGFGEAGTVAESDGESEGDGEDNAGSGPSLAPVPASVGTAM